MISAIWGRYLLPDLEKIFLQRNKRFRWQETNEQMSIDDVKLFDIVEAISTIKWVN